MEAIKYTPKVFKVLLGIVILTLSIYSVGQSCDDETPFFDADLSNAPDAIWESPLSDRAGNCCGTTNPDRCIEFEILLHEDAISINFEIASGAIPPGALFYQIDCGPEIHVGEPICLDGAGPHKLTFCKPGGNENTFRITSYPDPVIGPDIDVSGGCTDFIYANFYNVETMTWNSVFPGVEGEYNDWLDCTSGCDTVYVTAAEEDLPEYVHYEVCGFDAAGCYPDPICDIITVNLKEALTVYVSPSEEHLCYGENTTIISADATGGEGEYEYLWSTGETTESIEVGEGTYTVEVTDELACLVVEGEAVITQEEIPISAEIEAIDTDWCAQSVIEIDLTGTITGAEGGLWSAGSGSFSQSNTDLNTTYTPSEEDLKNGEVDIILSTTGNNGCEPDSDTVTVYFHFFNEDLDLMTQDVTCFDFDDGFAELNVTGDFLPVQYNWDGEGFTNDNTLTDISAGNYTVIVENDLGCDTTLFFEINQPELLTIAVEEITDAKCPGGSEGFIKVAIEGGTPDYTYNWEGVEEENIDGLHAKNLSSGDYSIQVTDENGCTEEMNFYINEPDPIVVFASLVRPKCNGSENGSITIEVEGGTPVYNFLWSNGSSAKNLYDLGAGEYILTVTDQNDCFIRDTIRLTEPDRLVGEISPNTFACPNEEVALGVAVEGGTGDYSYSWYPGDYTTDTIEVFVNTSTYFSSTITDENGCSIVLTTSVVIKKLDGEDLFAEITEEEICYKDSTGISAEYTGEDTTVTLNWLHCSPCDVPSITYEYPKGDTFYVVSATNTCDEIVYDTVHVVVNPLPEVLLDDMIAEVCPEETVSFIHRGEDNSNWNYLWDLGDGNQSSLMSPNHSYDVSGGYLIGLTIVDDNGCKGVYDGESFVTVNPRAYASFDVSSIEETMLDPTFQFFNFSENASNYVWMFGDGNYSINQQPSHTYSEHGNFVITLAANNDYDCPDTAALAVRVKPSYELYVPNAFTPDGDQFNNEFFAKGHGIAREDFTLYIYNRWGEVIFESHDMDIGWSGRAKDGNKAKEGVYVWVIYFKDLSDIRYRKEGHVTLLK